jgi:hypothetical protein
MPIQRNCNSGVQKLSTPCLELTVKSLSNSAQADGQTSARKEAVLYKQEESLAQVFTNPHLQLPEAKVSESHARPTLNE